MITLATQDSMLTLVLVSDLQARAFLYGAFEKKKTGGAGEMARSKEVIQLSSYERARSSPA